MLATISFEQSLQAGRYDWLPTFQLWSGWVHRGTHDDL